MTRRTLAVVGLAAAFAPAAHAIPLEIPSTAAPLTPSPPLAGTPQTELVFPGRLASRTRVLVSLDARGRVVEVHALNRVEVQAAGDYSFAVPAPVVDVSAAPGSASVPGLRQGAILWQGFSPGKRTLAADAVLRPRDTVPFLPLRVSLYTRARDGGYDTVLVVRNATAVAVPTPLADADPRAARGVLRRIRAALEAGRDVGPLQVEARPPTKIRQLHAVAPMRIEGTLREGSTVRRFRATLGPAGPLRLTVRLRTSERPVPRLRLEASPAPLAAAARQQRGRTGRALLAAAVTAALGVARSHQYEAFLRNPDGQGTTATEYVFETATAAHPGAVRRHEEHGTNTARVVISLLVLAAAAVGLVVLWAHS